jgi:hypothetical protein
MDVPLMWYIPCPHHCRSRILFRLTSHSTPRPDVHGGTHWTPKWKPDVPELNHTATTSVWGGWWTSSWRRSLKLILDWERNSWRHAQWLLPECRYPHNEQSINFVHTFLLCILLYMYVLYFWILHVMRAILCCWLFVVYRCENDNRQIQHQEAKDVVKMAFHLSNGSAE